MIRSVLILLAACMLTQPALARGEAGPAERERPSNIFKASFTWAEISGPNEADEAADAFAPPDYNYVDLPHTVAPIVSNGRLVGYAFVMARLRLEDSVDMWRVREKSHLLLDVLVHTLHDTPFDLSGAAGFDDAAAREALLSALGQALPEGWVLDVVMLGRDVRMLGD